MALRTIRVDGDSILRKVSRPVDKFDESLDVLLNDMLETMKNSEGIGLAAPQVGILRRAVVIDLGDGPIKMVNPEIIKSEGEEIGIEGCLSIPGYEGEVKRPKKITVDYLDEKGKKKSLEASDLMAVCICHEIDHLNGILYKDKAINFKLREED